MRNPLQKRKGRGVMEIQQIMNQPAITCRPSDTLNTAAQQMWEHDCGAVLVVGDEGRVISVVTDRDVCMAAYTQGRPLTEIPVKAAMSSQAFCCHPGDSVDAAEQLMREKQVRRVPVVDEDGTPLGLLSLSDVARYGVSSAKKGRVEHEITHTLAAICTPRHEALQPVEGGDAGQPQPAMA